MWKNVGILAALLVSAVPCYAVFGWKLDGTLDKPAISHSYFEGEFARILPPLEAFRQSFPKSATEKSQYTLGLGKGKGKAEFNFHSLGAGMCELWIRLTAQTDDAGNTAEAYFVIDYLEISSIEAFSKELIRMGDNKIKVAELKNKFENH